MLHPAVLARRVWNEPVYQKHSSEFMLARTKDYIQKDKDVIDVGAAVGMYSYFFSQHGRNVYSFEAVPEVFRQLKTTVDANSNINAINKGVGRDSGTATFYVDDKRLSNSGFQDLVGGYPIEVEVVKLDDQFADVDIDLGFLKVDTEGTELDVLNGANNLIEKHSPTCMIEIYPKFDKFGVIHTFDFFFDRGYSCYYNMKQDGLQLVNSPEHGEEVAGNDELQKVHDSDFLFVKE